MKYCYLQQHWDWRDCNTEEKCSRGIRGEVSYDIPLMWNQKKNDANELTKQKETHRLGRWISGCWGEKQEEGIVREFGMDMYTLLYIK